MQAGRQAGVHNQKQEPRGEQMYKVDKILNTQQLKHDIRRGFTTPDADLSAPAAGGTHNSKIFPGEQPSEPQRWRMTL